MAYDESLMDCVNDEESVFLRFFNFSPFSVSLGYHQKIGQWLRTFENRGFKWVRRRTGGRAIIHVSDCTYSLVFHRENPVIGGNVLESYRKTSFIFKKAFELLGVETHFKRGSSRAGKKQNSEMCFSAVSFSDLCWENRKIMGSAQYRDKDLILQEGTTILETPIGFYMDDNIGTIKMAIGREITLSEIKNHIIQAFEEVFGGHFKKFEGNPLKKELLLKYSSPIWNYKGNSLCRIF
jgi:lipoate-protein ligase A